MTDPADTPQAERLIELAKAHPQPPLKPPVEKYRVGLHRLRPDYPSLKTDPEPLRTSAFLGPHQSWSDPDLDYGATTCHHLAPWHAPCDKCRADLGRHREHGRRPRRPLRLVALALTLAAVAVLAVALLGGRADAATPGQCEVGGLGTATGTYTVDRDGYLFTLSAPRAESRLQGPTRSTVTVVAMHRDGPLWPIGRYKVSAARNYRPNLDDPQPVRNSTAPRADVAARTDSPIPGVPDRVTRCSFRLVRT